MNWRPIETAPKDGESILLFCPNYRMCGQSIIKAWWDDDGWMSSFGQVGYFSEIAKSRQGDPTHWMSLPPPPSTEPAPPSVVGNIEPLISFILALNESCKDAPDGEGPEWELFKAAKEAALNLLAGHDLSQVSVVKKEVAEEALQALRRAGGYAHFVDAQETVKACKAAHDKLDASLNAGGDV